MELSEEFEEGQEVVVHFPDRDVTGTICGKAYEAVFTGWIIKPHIHHLDWLQEQAHYRYSTFVAPHVIIDKI